MSFAEILNNFRLSTNVQSSSEFVKSMEKIGNDIEECQKAMKDSPTNWSGTNSVCQNAHDSITRYQNEVLLSTIHVNDSKIGKTNENIKNIISAYNWKDRFGFCKFRTLVNGLERTDSSIIGIYGVIPVNGTCPLPIIGDIEKFVKETIN